MELDDIGTPECALCLGCRGDGQGTSASPQCPRQLAVLAGIDLALRTEGPTTPSDGGGRRPETDTSPSAGVAP